MRPIEAIDRLYYHIALSELRLMNANTLYPHITYNSLLYLDVISYTQDCTVSHLAQILHVSKAAVTKKVNELIKQGFVVKTQSKDDRRIFFLSLSDAVNEDFEQYDSQLIEAVKVLEERYTQEELDKFSQMLNLISGKYLERD